MTYAEEAPEVMCLTKRPTDRSDGRTVELGRYQCVYKDRSLSLGLRLRVQLNR